MRVVEPLADLHDDVAGLGDRHRLPELLGSLEDGPEVPAGDVLESDVKAVLLVTQVVDLGDVAVVELDGDLRLVLEHRDELVVLGDVREDALDRDRALEALDPILLGLVDLGHAADAHALEQQVRSVLRGKVHRRLQVDIVTALGRASAPTRAPRESPPSIATKAVWFGDEAHGPGNGAVSTHPRPRIGGSGGVPDEFRADACNEVKTRPMIHSEVEPCRIRETPTVAIPSAA